MVQVVNAGSNFASIYASYFYPKTDGPRYVMANILNIGFSGMCILMATTLHFVLRRRNMKLDRFSAEDMEDENTTRGSKTMALSESLQCHPDYRYTL